MSELRAAAFTFEELRFALRYHSLLDQDHGEPLCLVCTELLAMIQETEGRNVHHALLAINDARARAQKRLGPSKEDPSGANAFSSPLHPREGQG